MWLLVLLSLAQQPIRMVAPDVPAHGILSDSSSTEPGGRRAEFFGFRCVPGLAVQIDALSSWDNIAILIGPDGRVRKRDDDSGAFNNARIAWTCPDDALYRIAVASYHYEVGGAFDLWVTPTNEAGRPAGLALIRPDTIVRAVLPAGAPRYLDHPMATYAFRCAPDLVVTIGMASLFDNMLFLFGPAGLVDSSDDADGTNGVLLYRCHDSEIYRIGAAARDGQGGGPYRLHLTNVRAGAPRP
jgi:hypothetical protein